MVTIFQIINVSHVTVTLLAPVVVFAIRPVASVVAGQTLGTGDVMQHKLDFSSRHLTLSDLKPKILPTQRYCINVIGYFYVNFHTYRNLLKCFLSQQIQCMKTPLLEEVILPTLTLLANYDLLLLSQSHHNMK